MESNKTIIYIFYFLMLYHMNILNDINGGERGVPVSKLNKKELLKQLLELEDDNVGEVGILDAVKKDEPIQNTESIDVEEETVSVQKPKKKLTEKQLEALRKGQEKRNENRVKNKLEKDKKEQEERKILEEKLVKKAIAVKKKQIKKQAVLDEISDDETAIEKVKAIAATPVKPVKPVSLFKFF